MAYDPDRDRELARQRMLAFRQRQREARPRLLTTCAHCGQQFEALRSTARYCGSACRWKAAMVRRQQREQQGD